MHCRCTGCCTGRDQNHPADELIEAVVIVHLAAGTYTVMRRGNLRGLVAVGIIAVGNGVGAAVFRPRLTCQMVVGIVGIRNGIRLISGDGQGSAVAGGIVGVGIDRCSVRFRDQTSQIIVGAGRYLAGVVCLGFLTAASIRELVAYTEGQITTANASLLQKLAI